MHVSGYTALNDPFKKTKKQKTQLYLPCTQLKVTAQSAEAHLFMGINMGYVSKRLKNKFLILPHHTQNTVNMKSQFGFSLFIVLAINRTVTCSHR